MRARPISIALWLLAAAVFCIVPASSAQDKTQEGKGLKVEGELTKDDPKIKVDGQSHHKVQKFKMLAGKTYRIDLVSKDFDSFLMLEDPTGKKVAENDDISEDNLNARIVYKVEKEGEYRIIVTTYKAGETGKYLLTVVEASAADLLQSRLRNIGKSPREEQKQILAELTKTLAEKKDKLSEQDADLAFDTASALERSGNRELAAEAYASLGKILAGSSDKQVTHFGKLFQGAARRMNLVGQPIEIKGMTLDGKAVDWKSYRGKVVLVDFWATWCPPCVAEMPNIKKAYETYHKRGFDVVAISLDDGKNEAVKFMEGRKLPWVCLFDKTPGEGNTPLAEYYGVFSIPQAILVDREGRVISLNARGEELERLLQKHIGPEKKPGGDK